MKALLTTICLLTLSFSAMAKTKIKSVDFNRSGNTGKMVIKFQTPLNETPELSVKDKTIQVAVPGSFVWPKIEKNVSVNQDYDTKVLAYQFNKDVVRVRAVLPYAVENDAAKVSLIVKDKAVELTFPVKGQRKKQVVVAPIKKKKKTNYDESYLEKLLSDKEISKFNEVKPGTVIKAKAPVAKKVEAKKEVKDTVATKMAAPEKKSQFSMMTYIGKFVAFLGLILLFFYAVVVVLKKGVFKKGKLGFLNSTKVVEVLNNTYIAPKKSIMTIRAHDQILLVGVDDKGMHFLTEVKNPAGYLKDGEKQLAGDNFDTNLGTAETKDKEFNLKEIIDQPAVNNNKSNTEKLSSFLSNTKNEEAKDKVKLSDQIKDKVKGLKSLQ